MGRGPDAGRRRFSGRLARRARCARATASRGARASAARWLRADARSTPRTTPIAAHYLRLAAGGHYTEPLVRLRRALLCEDDVDVVDAALRTALAVGATSGADTVSGLSAGLRAWLPMAACTKRRDHGNHPLQGLRESLQGFGHADAAGRQAARARRRRAGVVPDGHAGQPGAIAGRRSVDRHAGVAVRSAGGRARRARPLATRRSRPPSDAAVQGRGRRRRRGCVLAAADQPRARRRAAHPTPTSR